MTHSSPENATLADRLERNARDCEDMERWATPELAPLLREAAQVLRSFHHAQETREPDAWEWRACIGGKWGAWLYLDQPVERFCERNKFNLDNGTYILRPLYAFSSPESQS